MPKYFIDVTENGRRSEDHAGLELASDRAAIQFVWDWLREILMDASIGDDARTLEVSLRDSSGAPIYEVTTTGQPVRDRAAARRSA